MPSRRQILAIMYVRISFKTTTLNGSCSDKVKFKLHILLCVVILIIYTINKPCFQQHDLIINFRKYLHTMKSSLGKSYEGLNNIVSLNTVAVSCCTAMQKYSRNKAKIKK